MKIWSKINVKTWQNVFNRFENASNEPGILFSDGFMQRLVAQLLLSTEIQHFQYFHWNHHCQWSWCYQQLSSTTTGNSPKSGFFKSCNIKNTRKWDFRIHPAKIDLWTMTIQAVKVAGSKFGLVTSWAQNCEIPKFPVCEPMKYNRNPM